MEINKNKILLAFVGMPGAGKSEAVLYLKKKGIPFVRFGEITDQGVKEKGLPLNPENERKFREEIRQNYGMAAYAIKSENKIKELLKENRGIAIDGLYSWEEYTFLKEKFPGLILINIFSEPQKRYERLKRRGIRPISFEQSRKRDIAEIEELNKGGPIAMADYLIDNSKDDLKLLYKKIDFLLMRLGVNL